MTDTLKLIHTKDNKFMPVLNGDEYSPTDDTTFVGALIFALKPARIETDGKRCTEQFKMMAAVTVHHLKAHAAGRTIPEHHLDRWREGAMYLGQTLIQRGEIFACFEQEIKQKAFAFNY